MTINRQVVFALLLLALDAGYLWQARELPVPFARGEPGPAFVPLILVVLLAAGALGVLVEELRGTVTDGEPEGSFALRSVALMALTAGFVWLFEPLGYWIATGLYTFAVAFLFEQERVGAARAPLTALPIAAGVTTAGWLFFVLLFDLFLPAGML